MSLSETFQMFRAVPGLTRNLTGEAPDQVRSRARLVALFGLLFVAGCGFTPVHAPGGTASDLRGRIDFASPADEEGFALVKRLEDRLGLPQAADLALTADIRIEENALGFLPDGEISRYNVTGQVDWRLTRLSDASEVSSGQETSFTGYSTTSTTVATRFAQRDARRRLMVILADRIVADLISTELP